MHDKKHEPRRQLETTQRQEEKQQIWHTRTKNKKVGGDPAASKSKVGINEDTSH
jgi:hypothetical protein